jgi:hypothetical protein
MLSAGPLAPFQPFGATRTATDDYGNTIAQAALITLSTTGTGAQSGKIETAGDVDVFSFVAPVSGTMTIRQQAARVNTSLSAYSVTEQLLASSNANPRTGGIQITVTAGSTYYVKMAASGRGTGSYAIQFVTTPAVTDDYGNTMAQATALSLSESGSGVQSGKIEKAGDVDVFSIVAPVTGTMTIQQAAATGSKLDSVVYVYSSSGQLLAQNDNSGASRNSLVEFDVVAGSTYYVKAAARGTSTGAYNLQLSTEAATTTTPSEDGFQIDVTITGMTDAEEAIVEQAVTRWEQIIVGDLPDVTYRGQAIDDVQIAISGITIDGSGSVLGQSSVTAVRSDSCLPCAGYIQLDTADVATMLSNGSLLGVLEHEIAHVLGFGVIWSELGLLTGSNTSNPGFTGANAVAEYNSIFGTSASAVPVEADGGSGTALSHWDESVFDNELMTGWYNSGETNALSRITVASMADLGYQVNMAAADSYTAPTSTSTTSVVTTSSIALTPSVRLSAAIATSKAALNQSSISANLFASTAQNDQSRAVDLILKSTAAISRGI